ncbi:MAG: metallophosphoesterase [Clostridia bacterium]|nr:metallophosphoesterase [Clostridia bacterium]
MRMLFSLLALMAALMPAARAEEGHTFVIATDLHYISPALTDHGAYFTRMLENGDGKVTAYIDELTDAFLQEVIARRPDCLILSGDLTFNGARKSHEDLAAKLHQVRDAGIPVYVIPGNHDLHSYMSASFEGDAFTRVASLTSDEFAGIYHDLGFDAARSRDPYSLSYMAEPVPGVRLLMLDTNTRHMEGAVAQNTFAWLEAELQSAQQDGAKVVAVSHQNLLAHSSLLSDGFVIANASLLRSLYERYGVSVNLSGHIHMQHTAASKNGLPEIVTSSLAVSPCQYGVIDIAGGTAQYRTEAVDVAAWAGEAGKTDENLLHFDRYAADFFRATTARRAAAQLGDTSDAAAMTAFMAELNAAYFSGRMDAFVPDADPAGRWIRSDAFFGVYVQSILSEERRDHTRLSFPL